MALCFCFSTLVFSAGQTLHSDAALAMPRRKSGCNADVHFQLREESTLDPVTWIENREREYNSKGGRGGIGFEKRK